MNATKPTMQPLRQRINRQIYIALIKKKSNYNMSLHFNRSHPLSELQFLPLEKIDDSLSKRKAEEQLLKRETWWIRRLSSLQPFGMNYVEVDTNQRTF